MILISFLQIICKKNKKYNLLDKKIKKKKNIEKLMNLNFNNK